MLADFTALAPNSAVAGNELGIGVSFTALASAHDFQLLARPQPAPPYAAVACITAALPAQNFYTYALGWRESASGKPQDQAVIHSAPQAFPIEDWWPWLRIEDDGRRPRRPHQPRRGLARGLAGAAHRLPRRRPALRRLEPDDQRHARQGHAHRPALGGALSLPLAGVV